MKEEREMLSPQSIAPNVLKRILKEIQEIRKSSPEGIELIENESNFLDLQAIIDGPGIFTVNHLLTKSSHS